MPLHSTSVCRSLSAVVSSMNQELSTSTGRYRPEPDGQRIQSSHLTLIGSPLGNSRRSLFETRDHRQATTRGRKARNCTRNCWKLSDQRITHKPSGDLRMVHMGRRRILRRPRLLSTASRCTYSGLPSVSRALSIIASGLQIPNRRWV